ncbi:transcription-repair coupling factor [Meiothermus hypogaeus]|uniref:Transcription-repair-coupling factor n=1 Tax=Meiothermus hypogaeus NBRC 106114 TaxID=1227553 RepID=A0A511R427_9DEIN|nr:transcription-repair coupling factor [Meiothermus hypogaeus]GEM84358.1 transcription-repair-coupling factor [Meiothermus hypogaeus NBRC 106114]
MNTTAQSIHNHYLPGLPQVARALLFAQGEGPRVLLCPPERLSLYADLGALGVSAYVNPGLEAVGEAQVVVMSYPQALEAFPAQPENWRLVLEVGRSYLREDLLERLYRMGYLREEDYRVQGDVLELEEVRMEFFGDELDGLKVAGEPRQRYILTAREGKAETWDAHKILHFPGTVYLDTPALAPEALWPLIAGRDRVTFGLGGPELPTLPLPYRPLPPYRARISQFVDDVRTWMGAGFSVVFFYRHPKSRSYLLHKLQGSGEGGQGSGELSYALAPDTLRSTPTLSPKPGTLNLVPAPFEGAFLDPERRTVYLSEAHLYAFGGAEVLRNRRVVGGEGADPGALSVGDYLIHPEHGIGQYLGLETREVLGAKRDYLVLQYAGEGKMYLPVEQLPLLKRHPGTTDDPPALSSLGKSEWKRTREKAQRDAEELAQRMLVMHAKREATPGRAFGPLPEWDSLVEQNFPFELTPDQHKALEETLRDLEAPRPMERLISGDVGFGKTEVALRAAHRVVGHGAQVAVLVPTTLLAEQHTQTFRKRLEGLPVRVAGLSRFTSEKEASEILRGLASGSVDIVIGTHRLLSPDVRFKDLGLLVVDEEHRFGVAQKERIRELKEAVDTLFLSATPIPRTLYSALVGLRDLSSIQTAPPGRKPIQTVLAPYDPALVRQGIMDELERGGKAFYVHDRVATILARRQYLEALVPEARIGVVHGQMHEAEVEETMLAFAEGAFDVLLATTIIESGLDIPEANTILVERADKLGLAALYQLRGRVGRRQEEAYAYLFHPLRLTEGAERRLAAIADLSDLGSGHLLAEKDMEIRGVGNLLGPEQHGHIRAVSLEIYTELLSEAIRKLKGEKVEPEHHVTLDLQLSARLTLEYIPSPEARSRFYGRLAETRNLAQLSRIAREIKERYGPAPEEVENFLALSKLRLVAQSKGVVSITEDMLHLQIAFETARLDYDAKALRALPFRVEPTQYPPGFRIPKKGLDPKQLVETLNELLYLVD